ncbi:MAG: PAS domain S-box protein, partial [Methanoregula sp.]
FYSLDEEWRFTIVNPAAEKAPFGRPAAELIGRVIWDLYPNLVGTRIHQHYLDAAGKNTLEHYEAQSPLNNRWYEVFMQGRKGTVDVYMRDITGRKKTEEVLREREEHLRHANELLEAVTAGTNVIIAAIDNNFNYTFFNNAYKEEIQRLTRKNITIGTNMLALFGDLPEQQRIVLEEWSRTLKGERTSKELAFGEPGQYRKIYNRLHTPIHDSNGGVIGAGEVAIDITSQVKAEEALRESEERMRFALETSQTGAWDLDLADHTAFHSGEHDRIFGYAEPLPVWTYEIFLNHVLQEDRDLVDAKFRHAIGTGGDWNFECRIRRNDGETRWIWAAGRHRPGGSGSLGKMSGIVQDITERKRADEALKESEERFRVIAETSPVLLSVSSISDGTVLFTNPAYDHAFGFRPGEIIGRPAIERFSNPAERSTFINTLRETGELRNREVRAIRKDGTPFWLSTSVAWIRFGGNEAMLGASVDITERKQAEEALLKTRDELEIRVEERTGELIGALKALDTEHHRLYDVLETLPVYVCLLDSDYRMPFANKYFRETFMEPEGRRCYDFLFNRTEPCETCESYTAMRTRAPHHWFWTGPNGRDYDIYDYPFTDTDGSFMILEMGIDITEQKKAEQALHKANAYNRSLIEASLDPLVTINPDGTISDVNKATIRVTGFSRGELIGTDFSDYFTEPEKAKAGYEKVFRYGSVTDYALEIRHRNGHVTPVVYNAAVYRDTAGNVTGAFAAARDITERQKAEDALRRTYDLLEKRVKDRTAELVQSNAQLKEEISQRRLAESLVKKTVSELYAAIESTADGIYAVDRAGRIIRYNQNFASMWKIPDELLQSGEDYKVSGYLKAQVKNPGLFKDNDDDYVLHEDRETYDMLELKDGRIFERYSKPQKMDSLIIGRVMSYRDVTDRRHAEEKLIASLQEKETLIREIHHRVKNNLQIISGLLYMTRKRTPDSATNSILTDMMMKIKTMAQIHTRLYESKQFDRINMGSQIRDQVADLSSIYGRSGAEIQSEIDAEEIYLPVDQAIPCALVVNEILSNAFKHAFRGRKHGNIWVSSTRTDDHIRIIVRDDGVGIPRDVDVERSTSLGLKLIRSLVLQLKGSVTITSDHGTNVTVEFPLNSGGT